MTVKEYLKSKMVDGIDFWDLPYEVFGEGNIKNWPVVTDDDDEPLDMENFSFLSVSDTNVVISCGGDWQDPMTLTLCLKDDNLVVTEVNFGYTEGMDEEEFNNIVK